MSGGPLDDRGNGGSVDAFFTYGEDGFSSMGSGYYSREWIWSLRTKLCFISSGK